LTTRFFEPFAEQIHDRSPLNLPKAARERLSEQEAIHYHLAAE
jgi:hypothetical protein